MVENDMNHHKTPETANPHPDLNNQWAIDIYGDVKWRGDPDAIFSDKKLDKIHADRALAQAEFDSSLPHYGLSGEADTQCRHTALDHAINDIFATLERENIDETSSYAEQFLDGQLTLTLARAIHDRHYDDKNIEDRIAAYEQACQLLIKVDTILTTLPDVIASQEEEIQTEGDKRTALLDKCNDIGDKTFELREIISETAQHSQNNYASLQDIENRLKESPDDPHFIKRKEQETQFGRNNNQILTDARDQLATYRDYIDAMRDFAHGVIGLDFAIRIKRHRLDVAEYEKITATIDESTGNTALTQAINETRHYLYVYQSELDTSRKQLELIREMEATATPQHAAV